MGVKSAWVDQVKATIGIDAAASKLGLRRGRMSSFGPCPLCGADARGSGDNRLPIGVGREKGRWHCWKCNEGGDVLDLVSALRLGQRTDGLDPGRWATVREACAAFGWCDAKEERHERTARPGAGRKIVGMRSAGRAGAEEPSAAPPERQGGGTASWSPTLADDCAARLWTDAGAAALDYLRSVRKLSDETIRAFGLGALDARDGSKWVAIPLQNGREEVVNVRFRSVPPACSARSGLCGCDRCDDCRKAKGYRVCSGRPLPLFGAQNLSNDVDATVIVTEGELDVVALYEFGYTRGVVSGTGGATTLKDEWLDELEPFKGFVLAYDDDAKGEEGAALLADRLGRYRCSRAILPRKDAGECLADGLSGDEIEAAIDRSKGMLSTEITSIGVFEDEVERLVLRPSELVGRPTGSARLDKALGGLRPGLIIITGETGTGKTTFATWLLSEQARAGIPSLLTSFEQSPIGSVQKLLRAELGGDFLAFAEAQRRAAMRALDARPLKLVRHRGQMPFDELHDIVRFAVRRLGIRNLLIDHLGFVVDADAEDERREIQTVVRALSIIAEHEGVSIFLVCHPSNQHVQQRRRVSLADLKGASAIRQDAHEVWVVESAKPTQKRPWPGTWIHLDKIRSDFGASGSSVLLAFDPLATVYADDWSLTPSGKRGVRVVVPSGKTPSAKRPKHDGKNSAAGPDRDDGDPEDAEGDGAG